MHKSDKERVVAELTERLRTSDTLLVADYRGLTNAQIDELRIKLVSAGARFTVVKNTLTRRAAEAAGADALLALLEGPTAIAFLEADGDPVAVAKALGDVSRETNVLELRGGIMQGASITAEQVAELAKLPPVDVLRGQVIGAITAPLMTIVGLFNAPLQDLVGLIDARIEQLGGAAADADAPTAEAEAASEVEVEAEADAPADEPAPETEASAEAPAADAEEATEPEASGEPAEAEAQAQATADEPAEPETTDENDTTQEEA
jgi:large subunit ribosomal protein L10